MWKKRCAVALIFFVTLLCAIVVSREPATADDGAQMMVKKLTGRMVGFELSVLSSDYTFSSEQTIALNRDNKARAAALTLRVKDENGVTRGVFGNYETFRIPDRGVKKASKNLFGCAASKNNLTKGRSSSILDAYKLKDGTPVVYYMDGGSEADYTVRKVQVKKQGEHYVVTKDVFYGYWRNNNGSTNYRISYLVKPDSDSKYGYTITSMKVREKR